MKGYTLDVEDFTTDELIDEFNKIKRELECRGKKKLKSFIAEVEFIETKGFKIDAEDIEQAKERLEEAIASGDYTQYLTREPTEIDFREQIILLKEAEE